MPTKKPNRRNLPLFVTMPPLERERLTAFAASIGRPFSWVVRDAVAVYLDAVQADGDKLARLRAAVAVPGLDLRKAGRTVQVNRGRPRKVKP